jgi:uncharacterized membrane protein
MSDLIVLAFDNENGAIQLRDKLASLQKQQIIEPADAALVIRRQDGKVKVRQAHSLVGAGTLGGAFWGMLIGLIFFMPWLGMAFGALGGAIGVDDKFIKEVSSTIEPGHSALFLLVEKVTEDKLTDELKGTRAKVLQTSLSKKQEAKLRDLFGADEIEI